MCDRKVIAVSALFNHATLEPLPTGVFLSHFGVWN